MKISQKELLELASNYSAVPKVKFLTDDLVKNIKLAESYRYMMQIRVNRISFSSDHRVGADNSDIVSAAYKLASTLDQIYSGFFSLACALEALGEQFEY